MTQLLVSVRDEEEAETALRGGADWIDLKEPARGPLGYVYPDVAARVVAAVGKRAPISAAAGELSDWIGWGPAFVHAVPGVKLLKLGLAGQTSQDWKDAWLRVQHEASDASQGLVPVMYADFKTARAPSPAEILPLLSESSGDWVLIDTFDKSAGGLLDVLDRAALVDLLGSIRDRGKRTVVAGRLTAESMGMLPLELVEVVGVRGAACEGGRTSAICASRVARLRSLISNRGAGAAVMH
jgi:uncharacterized protein (UPF0264 family)